MRCVLCMLTFAKESELNKEIESLFIYGRGNSDKCHNIIRNKRTQCEITLKFVIDVHCTDNKDKVDLSSHTSIYI